MNKKNVLALADFIEQHKELPFDMQLPTVPNSCGTAGCVGGFAGAFWPDVEDDDGCFRTERLARHLDVDRTEVWMFCYQWPEDIDDSRDGAVSSLRHSANVGKLEWL